MISKRDSLISLCKKLGISKQELIYAYPDEAFVNYLTKSLADQALNLNISKDYEEKLNSLCNISYNKDARTPVEYAIDLIFGWMVEDSIAAFLEQNNFEVEKMGADSERAFLQSGRITTDIDAKISIDGKSKTFDIYFDSQGYWEKYDKIDIRESKWKAISKDGSAVICVSNAGFAIIDCDSEHTFGPNPLWGGKKCATINGIKSKLIDLDSFIVLLKSKIKE